LEFIPMSNYVHKTFLVTGAAGFVGAFLCKRLLEETDARVVGFDNMSDYYDVGIKEDRLRMLEEVNSGPGDDSGDDSGNGAGSDSGSSSRRFTFVKGDLADAATVNAVFERYQPSVVVNLAAQAGVRYSIDNPRAYVDSNLIGFFNILEACRHHTVEHLVFASSSSVYGTNEKVPYSTDDKVDNPVSLYAATKKSNELMAHAYSKLYDIPCTGLRFFTVYGPMGRPDMAYFKFTDKMVKGEPIQIYNRGDMRRDFTYIDDIVMGVADVMGRIPGETKDGARYKIYNIGNSHPEPLGYFVETLERVLMEEGVIDKPTEHELLPMQPGDVYQTYADVSDLERDFAFKPSTPLEQGLRRFAKWYKGYYGL
jgi:nucleoside-diphosphate-sugar epimerase